jgi:hypothetical protein
MQKAAPRLSVETSAPLLHLNCLRRAYRYVEILGIEPYVALEYPFTNEIELSQQQRSFEYERTRECTLFLAEEVSLWCGARKRN